MIAGVSTSTTTIYLMRAIIQPLQFIRFRTDHTDMWMDPSLYAPLERGCGRAFRPSCEALSGGRQRTMILWGKEDTPTASLRFADWSD